MKLTKVCGWCNKTIRQGDPPDAPVTTGICDTCLLTHFGFTKEQLEAFHASPSPTFILHPAQPP